MLLSNKISSREDADDDTLLRTLSFETWSRQGVATRPRDSGARRLRQPAGLGGRDHVPAPVERVVRAAELVDADGQLRELEQLGAEPDQPRQRRQPQGQVHGLARRPEPSQQGDRILYAACRGRLSVCGQPVAAVLEVRRPQRKADRGVEVRRQGAERRQERPQHRAAWQQRLLQHRQRQSEPAPRRARQEFRRGRFRRRHHDPGCRAEPGPFGGTARHQEYAPHRAGQLRRERPRLCGGLHGRHRQAAVALPRRPQSGPARLRDLGRPAHHSDRRRRGVDRAVVRSRDEPCLFRHREPGAHVRPAGPSRRQPLYQLHHRARRRYREAEVALPDGAERILGLRFRSPSPSSTTSTSAARPAR